MNRLQYETSPYLLQHKDNPVDWYPWCREAFERAKAEDKPVFLSIGYSTCHWCHVLAHESFEDPEISGLLNRYFISIKVDREERPDIDSVYMAVCQAFTGSGGWPTSIFMTAEQKPFFAGTYFPKTSRGGMLGMRELLLAIGEKWEHDRGSLLLQADEVTTELNKRSAPVSGTDSELIHTAIALYKRLYDKEYGGFGTAPKFPAAHNLLFLLSCFERYHDTDCLRMTEHTLLQMYRGGLFDHIGYGFCRYSTDNRFLVPHFEKMLYDNALLTEAYSRAYAITKKPLYRKIAEKTAAYLLREMTSPEGGFYSAQDADSEGEEGKYYLFAPEEITSVLGSREGEDFCRHFDIREAGNFEGENIPNLLHSDPGDSSFDVFLPLLERYRKQRRSLPLDDKILTAWNGLMTAALCTLYLVSGKESYLEAARRADAFVQKHLCEKDTLFVSFREGKRGVAGLLDDYASCIFSLLKLYRATLNEEYAQRARCLCDKVLSEFEDASGGFYLYGEGSERLISRPKETYDGAVPSGNSLMAYNLVRLAQMTGEERYQAAARRQLDFLSAEALSYPPGYALFLTALSEYEEPPVKVIAVPDGQLDCREWLLAVPPEAVVVLRQSGEEYPLQNGKTTYYVCRGHRCLPPVNDLQELLHSLD
ncbi:MAG: thioredoxin domain-containing protein [Clostridiales bacterium]|nr:thioredoxin domain-containing protein [Clostridiales bacterium]